MGVALKVKYFNGSGGIVKDGVGALYGYVVSVAAASKNLRLFDGTNSAGIEIARLAISNGGEKSMTILLHGTYIEFSTGLFAEFPGAAASTACIYYK